jgi:hypothetical protein
MVPIPLILGDAVTWCTGKDAQLGLWAESLKPSAPLLDASDPKRGEATSAAPRPPTGRSRPRADAPAVSPADGGLLVFRPDDSLSDGAAAAESQGLFDDDNTPAWATWLTYLRVEGRYGFLVSWIPPLRMRHASLGIDVNPEGCIGWVNTMLDEAEKRELDLWLARQVG